MKRRQNDKPKNNAVSWDTHILTLYFVTGKNIIFPFYLYSTYNVSIVNRVNYISNE